MKQLIVLIATIVLGLSIAMLIMGFKSDATKISGSVSKGITDIVSEYTTGSAIH